MNIETRPARSARTLVKPAIADCDVHPLPKSVQREIYPFLEKKWRDVFETYGEIQRHGFVSTIQYPKGQPNAARRDAFPPTGGAPGSDLDFMRKQHLDANNVAFGVLIPLRSGQSQRNVGLATAMCTAINDWLVAEWTSKEPRLKGSALIPYEDPRAAVAEIERRAGDPNFVQFTMLSRTPEPMGNRIYWPIYEAAAETGMPIGVHAFGYGGDAVTGGGWPSYYIEDMVAHAQSAQSLVASMVLEGVFERLPKLKLVIVETGISWMAPVAWRLDKVFEKNRAELSHLRRKPSEYMREHIWLTSQPIEEPSNRHQLVETMEWIGWDRIVFASDYPHWDFDDPAHVLPVPLSPEQRQDFFYGNAAKLYGLPNG